MASTTTAITLLLQARDEASSAIAHVTASLDGLHEHLRRIGDIALGTILGNLGVTGIEDATRGVVDFGKSLVETSANMELMRQRLNILYQSTTEGAQAFAFLQQQELTKPFNIEDIVSASTQLVAFHQNLVTVLPALEDVAGAMGQTLPVAARAFNDAISGRFQMMKNDLGISKEALVQFGLQMDKTGHITDPNSFVSAFLKLANSAEFKGGADKLAQTWTGLMSSMSSQWTYFKMNLGAGAFQVLERQLSGLVHTLQNPATSAALQQFERGLGAGLASATVSVLNFARTVGPYLGSAIIVAARAWNILESAVAAAFNFISPVIGGFVNWFTSAVVPGIETGLGMIAQWWQANAAQIRSTLATLAAGVQTFLSALSGLIRNAMEAYGGYWQAAWGYWTIVFSTAMSVITGDWSTFQANFNKGINDIMAGFVNFTAGIMSIVATLAADIVGYGAQWAVPLADGLIHVADSIGHTLNDLFTGVIQPFAAAAAGVFSMAFTPLIDAAKLAYNAILVMVQGLFHALPDNILATLHVPGAAELSSVDTRVQALKMQSLTSPQDAFKTGQSAANAFLSQHQLGLMPTERLSAGVSEQQARADIEKARQGILAPILADLEAHRKAILAQYGLNETPGKGPTYQQSGRDLIKGLFGPLFAGTGGNLTLPDFLKALGLDKVGANITIPSTAIPTSLPVPGVGPTADATAAAAGGRGIGSPLAGPTGRVPLGALGATFMQTIATGGPLGTGADPATRAAQRTADAQSTHTRLLTDMLHATGEVAASTGEMVQRLEALTAALLKHGLPKSTDPMQSYGVKRPAF